MKLRVRARWGGLLQGDDFTAKAAAIAHRPTAAVNRVKLSHLRLPELRATRIFRGSWARQSQALFTNSGELMVVPQR